MDGAKGTFKNMELELSLFDLKNDPGETKNVIDGNPRVATELQAFANAHMERFYK